jgi:hypothetical protein
MITMRVGLAVQAGAGAQTVPQIPHTLAGLVLQDRPVKDTTVASAAITCRKNPLGEAVALGVWAATAAGLTSTEATAVLVPQVMGLPQRHRLMRVAGAAQEPTDKAAVRVAAAMQQEQQSLPTAAFRIRAAAVAARGATVALVDRRAAVLRALSSSGMRSNG